MKILLLITIVLSCSNKVDTNRSIVFIERGLCSTLIPTIDVEKLGEEKRILKGEEATYKVDVKKLISIENNLTSDGKKNEISILNDKEFKYKAYAEGCDDLIITYINNLGKEVKDVANISIATKVKITYIIYLAGDNNLNGGNGQYNKDLDMVLKDLVEMEQSNIDKEKINVLLYIDVSASALNEYTKQKNCITSTGLYKLVDKKLVLYKKLPQDSYLHAATYKDYTNDIDTGKRETFIQCLDEAYQLSISENVFLDIWGHGDSLIGVSFDRKHFNDHLTPIDLKEGILKSKIRSIDVLNFSACLMMSLEVLYELKDVVKFVAGSPEYIPGDGSYYSSKNGILDWLSSTFTGDLSNAARGIADINFKSYNLNGGQYKSGANYFNFLTYSAVDLSNFDDDLIENMSNLFDKLDTEKVKEAIKVKKCLSYGARPTEHRQGSTEDTTIFYDFIDFLENLKDEVIIKNYVDKVMNSIKKLLIYNQSSLKKYDIPFRSGISIYYKPGANTFYESSKFSYITKWDKFF